MWLSFGNRATGLGKASKQWSKQQHMCPAIAQRAAKPYTVCLTDSLYNSLEFPQIGHRNSPGEKNSWEGERNGYRSVSFLLIPVSQCKGLPRRINCSEFPSCLIPTVWQPTRNPDPSLGSKSEWKNRQMAGWPSGKAAAKKDPTCPRHEKGHCEVAADGPRRWMNPRQHEEVISCVPDTSTKLESLSGV